MKWGNKRTEEIRVERERERGMGGAITVRAPLLLPTLPLHLL
jgi:hypothetical protein